MPLTAAEQTLDNIRSIYAGTRREVQSGSDHQLLITNPLLFLFNWRTRRLRSPKRRIMPGTAGKKVQEDLGHKSDRKSPTHLKFWGVRGSIPTPGPTTIRYGGNTSCIE